MIMKSHQHNDSVCNQSRYSLIPGYFKGAPTFYPFYFLKLFKPFSVKGNTVVSVSGFSLLFWGSWGRQYILLMIIYFERGVRGGEDGLSPQGESLAKQLSFHFSSLLFFFSLFPHPCFTGRKVLISFLCNFLKQTFFTILIFVKLRETSSLFDGNGRLQGNPFTVFLQLI